MPMPEPVAPKSKKDKDAAANGKHGKQSKSDDAKKDTTPAKCVPSSGVKCPAGRASWVSAALLVNRFAVVYKPLRLLTAHCSVPETCNRAVKATAAAAGPSAVGGHAAGGAAATATVRAAAAAPVDSPAVTKQQLLEAKAAARRDLGLERGGSGAGAAATTSISALHTKQAAATPGGGAGAGTLGAAASPWARTAVNAAVAATAVEGPPPSVHTLAQYPQLQQLLSGKQLKQQQQQQQQAQPSPSTALPLNSAQHFPPVKAAVAAAASTAQAPVATPAATPRTPAPAPSPVPAPAPEPAQAVQITSPLLAQLQRAAAAATAAAAAASAPASIPATAPVTAPATAVVLAPASGTPPPQPLSHTATASGSGTAAAAPSTPILPLPPSPSTVSAAASASLPVGMEYAEPDTEQDPSKLSKAQRKNLKRAERKKKVVQVRVVVKIGWLAGCHPAARGIWMRLPFVASCNAAGTCLTGSGAMAVIMP